MDWMPLLSAIAGGLIGTYCGAFFINLDTKKKFKDARKIAIRALDIFKKYKDKKYEDASNEFNASLTRAEKRIILVALYKIGIPISTERMGGTNDYEIMFRCECISINDIIAMKNQINSGKYDHLFFDDPDEFFSKKILTDYKRSIGIKFVNNVFMKSIIIIENGVKKIKYPDGWMNLFSVGEMNIAYIMQEKLRSDSLYEELTRLPKQKSANDIINEINIGLWDTYLDWVYEAFSNVQSQKVVADTVAYTIKIQQQCLMQQQNQQIAKTLQQETNNDAAK